MTNSRPASLHDQTTADRDPKDVEKRFRPLDAFFAGWRAVDLDEAAITRYVGPRRSLPQSMPSNPRPPRTHQGRMMLLMSGTVDLSSSAISGLGCPLTV